MKIRYLSDIHLEHLEFPPSELPSIGEDLVVLAGDIHVGLWGVKWAMDAIKDRPVVYVFGNHECYQYTFPSLIDQAKVFAAGSNVHVLEMDSFDVCGVRVLGCSYWTDFAALGQERVGESLHLAQKLMNDYRLIVIPDENNILRLLVPDDTRSYNQVCHRWLQSSISSSDRPVLVVTHHAPTLATRNPHFLDDTEPSNSAFHNHHDHLIKAPVVAWIHGHHHWTVEKMVNGIPVVSNQPGYPGEYVPNFSWEKALDVAV